jgi:hypothetical protein
MADFRQRLDGRLRGFSLPCRDSGLHGLAAGGVEPVAQIDIVIFRYASKCGFLVIASAAKQSRMHPRRQFWIASLRSQ